LPLLVDFLYINVSRLRALKGTSTPALRQRKAYLLRSFKPEHPEVVGDFAGLPARLQARRVACKLHNECKVAGLDPREKFVNFDPAAWEKMRSVHRQASPGFHFYGSDRDEGAVKMSSENAARAGVSELTEFKQRTISDITPPISAPGLVIVNPPYGTRIGDKRKLIPLYQTLGNVLRARFSNWRIGIITTDAALAKASSLPFLPTTAPVQHGGLRVTLFRTEPLT
jgi:hypothetical protein